MTPPRPRPTPSPKARAIQRLITEVKKRPVLWNVKHVLSNEYHLKNIAWHHIVQKLYPGTTENSIDEAEKINFIKKRWTSVREYYKRQREVTDTNSPQGRPKKKYKYFDMLQFLESNFEDSSSRKRLLLSAMSKDGSVESVEEGEETSDSSEEDQNDQFIINVEDSDDYTDNSISNSNEREVKQPSIKRPPRTSHSNETEKEQPSTSLPKQPICGCKYRNIDEDEMFFLSLLPSVRKFTPLQKLDFKLEVMETIKKIQYSQNDTQI